MFYAKGVLRNFTKFTENHLRQSLFFNKVADLKPATLFKNRFWHRCFHVNFVKFLRAHFLQNISGWLLLQIRNLCWTPPFFKFLCCFNPITRFFFQYIAENKKKRPEHLFSYMFNKLIYYYISLYCKETTLFVLFKLLSRNTIAKPSLKKVKLIKNTSPNQLRNPESLKNLS